MTTHHDHARLAAISLDAARLAGCTCTPEIQMTEEHPGMYRATVSHDDGCPLLTRIDGRTQP